MKLVTGCFARMARRVRVFLLQQTACIFTSNDLITRPTYGESP
jgi:hypothetical protein